MSLAAKATEAKEVGRLTQIARMVLKYRRRDLFTDIGRPIDPQEVEESEEFAREFEEMGPAFVKLGQLLSTRPDLLRQPYRDALSRLQDNVEPVPLEGIEQMLNDNLPDWRQLFRVFDPEPMGSASLGQVHRAILWDGREVAVKVQRPEAQERVAADMDALSKLAHTMDTTTKLGQHHQFGDLMDEFRKTLQIELDYRREAQSLEEMRQNLEGWPDLCLPFPIWPATTEKVLTMTLIRGQKLSEITPELRARIDAKRLANSLFRSFLHQIYIQGFIHADPHPGNLLVTEDGKLALLDVGMTSRLHSRERVDLLRLLLALQDDNPRLASDVAQRIGERTDRFDELALRREIAGVCREYKELPQKAPIGHLLVEMVRISPLVGLRIPPALSALSRSMLALDNAVQLLDPNFDFNAAIDEESGDLLRQSVEPPSRAEMVDFAVRLQRVAKQLPADLGEVVHQLAKGKLAVQVDAIDEQVLIDGMSRIANRITTGLVLAALIIGAAQLSRVYPTVAIVFFVLAGIGGIVLVGRVVWADWIKKKGRHG